MIFVLCTYRYNNDAIPKRERRRTENTLACKEWEVVGDIRVRKLEPNGDAVNKKTMSKEARDQECDDETDTVTVQENNGTWRRRLRLQQHGKK